uniref:Uncharacterized protein n=1 Tax=Lactiplantibacillus paraplantarum TaxID=60520 RepID=Q8RTK9_9LACO|nr:unknown [Lactiplantibacillus paraplantarum]
MVVEVVINQVSCYRRLNFEKLILFHRIYLRPETILCDSIRVTCGYLLKRYV